jgi:DNA/RNA-binding domain of Phe-tRNA-synthetase-like protein
MRVRVERRVTTTYPGLYLVEETLEGLAIAKRRDDLEVHKRELEESVRSEGSVDALKDEPRVRAYRDFFWSLGIDPTKIRPAAEALVRRIARGGSLPTINTAVDALNIASVETRVAFASFDMDVLEGDLTLRYAETGEEFVGIGMDRPKVLVGKELVIDDGVKLVAIYPYRDADKSKITLDTRKVLLLGCGVPGLGGRDLSEATAHTAAMILMYSSS